MTTVDIKAPCAHGFGAQIFSTETGEEIKGVSRLSIAFAVDDYARVEAELCAHAVEVKGAVAEFYVVNPRTGQPQAVKRIEFAEGDAWDAEETGATQEEGGASVVAAFPTFGAPISKRRVGKARG